jgi:hypothetical protein
MPLTNAADISMVLSGGTVNLNVNDSIGGEPSSSPVTDGNLNNLFSDVTSEQTAAGYEDYRCVYLFNDGETPVYEVELWIDEDFDGGAEVELGVTNRNESQRITISGGVVTGGTFTLSYRSESFVVTYDPNLAVWAASLQEGLDELEDDEGELFFDSVTVTAQNGGSGTVIFDIAFAGLDAKRNLDKLLLVSNALVSVDSITIFISAPSEGSPINTVAPEINVETTPPGGVVFFAATRQTPITLPILKPEDGFPLWIKRTVVAQTEAKEMDGFRLSFRSESLKQ